MDQGKEEVSKSLERSNNSKKKKIMEKTSDDQKELSDQMEQQASGKRLKTETTTHYPQRLKLLGGTTKNNPKFAMNKETDSEDTDEETDSAETTTHFPQRLKLLAGTWKERPKEQALVLSPKGSSKNNLKFAMNEETDSEETDEETDEEEPSVISPAGSSTNKPKGMKTSKEILRELKKKSKSNSCTSIFRAHPTDKFPDSDKDESKKRSPPVDQGSSCKKNL